MQQIVMIGLFLTGVTKAAVHMPSDTFIVKYQGYSEAGFYCQVPTASGYVTLSMRAVFDFANVYGFSTSPGKPLYGDYLAAPVKDRDPVNKHISISFNFGPPGSDGKPTFRLSEISSDYPSPHVSASPQQS